MNCFFKIMVLLLITNVLSAQSSAVKMIKGKVVSESVDLEGIYVINLKSESTASTEKGGYFSIAAAIGDTLMFSAIQIKGRKIVLTDKEFAKDLVLVQLEPMINRLDEVIVKQYPNINAVSLGIIPGNTKHYTPAQRKLKTASDADPSASLNGMAGGSVGLDPLLNWMSGRTAMLKKEVEAEKKEQLLQKIENQFGIDYFTEKLKIPKEYVRAFWYYIVDETRFVNAINAKNKTMATFVLAELATKYLELQKVDK